MTQSLSLIRVISLFLFGVGLSAALDAILSFQSAVACDRVLYSHCPSQHSIWIMPLVMFVSMIGWFVAQFRGYAQLVTLAIVLGMIVWRV